MCGSKPFMAHGCNVAFCCLTNGLLADQRNLQENTSKETLHVERVKFQKKLCS